jgi:hypothetical protein
LPIVVDRAPAGCASGVTGLALALGVVLAPLLRRHDMNAQLRCQVPTSLIGDLGAVA